MKRLSMSSDVTDHKRTEKRVGLFFFFFFSASGHVMTRPLFLDIIFLNLTLLFFSLNKNVLDMLLLYLNRLAYICGLCEQLGLDDCC